MNIDEFILKFKEEAEKNEIIDIDNEKIKQLYDYMKNILKWNEVINLTAIKDENEFIMKHFIDSLTILKYINENSKMIDIGTGAGFPGMPVKIVKPNLDITLVDSVNKKINVLKDIAEKMSIQKINLIHSRIEDIANQKEYREQFDYVTSRALSNITTLSEYMLPFLKINGKAICMKGPNFEEELENSKKAIDLLGGKIDKIDKLNINNELERNIIIIKKVKTTPKIYPRGKGKPLKEPLY